MWYDYITHVYGWLMILLRLLAFGNLEQLLKRHLPWLWALHSKNPFISSQCFIERQQNSCILYLTQNVFLNSFSQSTFFQPSKIKTTRNNNHYKSFMYLLQHSLVYIANFPFVLLKILDSLLIIRKNDLKSRHFTGTETLLPIFVCLKDIPLMAQRDGE